MLVELPDSLPLLIIHLLHPKDLVEILIHALNNNYVFIGPGHTVSVSACSYIFTCACICATFISATFMVSFIFEFFSAAILCSELTSSS